MFIQVYTNQSKLSTFVFKVLKLGLTGAPGWPTGPIGPGGPGGPYQQTGNHISNGQIHQTLFQ